jgi:hypothetical protein
VELGTGIATEGLGVGLDALVNGQPAPAPPAPQKRGCVGGRPIFGTGIPAIVDPNNNWNQDCGEDNEHSTPQKREPIIGAFAKFIPGLIDAGSAAVDAITSKRSEDAVEAHGNPEKREPIIPALASFIPGLVDAGTAAVDAITSKRSEDAVEARGDQQKPPFTIQDAMPEMVDELKAFDPTVGFKKRSEDAVEAHRNPEKREPIIGPFAKFIPDLVDAGTAAVDAITSKRSEDAGASGRVPVLTEAEKERLKKEREMQRKKEEETQRKQVQVRISPAPVAQLHREQKLTPPVTA